ncbi:MAG: SbcC/MukB-like Walker B domain-containing protein, partial [Gammaproteobacteria bacterium]
AGRFRCHWSQHRARKKPGGELQAPKHEMAHAESGRIVDAKLRGVAEQIEAATGLDFDRFTRSMLLAQGGFAAFLQAAPDERAPILEQITGTEIYSRISVRVHERRSDERKKLETLQAELSGLQLLSADDERQLRTELEQKLLAEAGLQRQCANARQALAWLDGITVLEQDLAALDVQQHELAARHAALQPELDKLELANRALELAGDYAALSAMRREQDGDQRQREACRAALPEQTAVVAQAAEQEKLAGEALQRALQEQKAALPVLRKVRELDVALREKQTPLKAAQANIAELDQALAAMCSRNDEDRGTLTEKKAAYEALQQLLDAGRADEALLEQLAGIRGRFEALQTLQAALDAKTQALAAAQSRHAEAVQVCAAQTALWQSRNSEFEAAEQASRQQQHAFNALLAGRELADWRRQLNRLSEQQTLLEKAGESLQVLADAKRLQDELAARRQTLGTTESALAQQLQSQSAGQAALERETQLLETQLTLLKKIHSFEEARHQLKDGEPCPLCGAEQHPFAAGNIPVPDDTAAALQQARAGLKQANTALSALQVEHAKTVKDLEQSALRQRECGERIAAEDARLQHCLERLGIDAAGDLPQVLGDAQRQNAAELAETAQLLHSAEQQEQQLAASRSAQETARDAALQAERAMRSAAHDQDSAQQAVQRLQQETAESTAQFGAAQREALCQVSAYGIQQAELAAPERVLQALTARRDQRLAHKEQYAELEKLITALDLQIRHRSEQIDSAVTDLHKRRAELSALLSAHDDLSRERCELFGERRPDAEEAILAAAADAAEREVQSARQALNAAVQALGKLESRLEAIEKSLVQRGASLQDAETGFRSRLQAAGFGDEAAYGAACLPEDERKRLQLQAQQLAKQQTELAARRCDQAARLQTEREKQLSAQPREQLAETLQGLTDALQTQQQDVGGIRRKLQDNDELRQNRRQRAAALDAQQCECARWDRLHELIGSADGKKYRNFAQGLTFEMMIAYANQQLQKMSDRYLLLRDEVQPLELSVIDNYHASEIRSTKNLSGGESFIVSLALALGLSQMASQNVRVDSLFLDEGFGTLDEDALDTALETLAGLQRDGKLIGVISHVAALKERIGTQIDVTPESGGKSGISGPGCRRI